MLQTVTIVLTAAAALLLLPALHRLLMMLGWEAGRLIGDAIAAAVRALMDLVAGLVRRHAGLGLPLMLPVAAVVALDLQRVRPAISPHRLC